MIENNDLLLKVCNIAIKAGEEILKYYKDDIEVTHKDDSSPLTKADLASNKIILNALNELDRTIPILSEESLVEWNQRKNWTTYWLVDPLDGTKEFIEGIPQFVVSVGLVENGKPVVGILHNPVTNETFCASHGFGSFLNDERFEVTKKDSIKEMTILNSRSENRKGLWDPFKNSFKKLKPIGSVAYKMGITAVGKADVFATLRPKNEWDVCAGVCLINEAGGKSINLNGQELEFNKEKTLIEPGIIAGYNLSVDKVYKVLNGG